MLVCRVPLDYMLNFFLDLLKDSWLDPFSKSLWMTLLGTYFGLIIVIWWLDRKSPQGHHRKLQESKDLYGFTLLGTYPFTPWAMFFRVSRVINTHGEAAKSEKREWRPLTSRTLHVLLLDGLGEIRRD